MTRPGQAPKQDGSENREPAVEHVDGPPPPPCPATETKDELRHPESFRLAHEGAGDWLLNDPPAHRDWVESFRGERLIVLPFHKDRLAALAKHDAPVLIAGAKGTGKQEFARLIWSHGLNPRKSRPFEVVDCESMQHGPEAGADLFGRGGGGGREGKLVASNGGTVLVRSIDRLPPECHARLVRFLARREVQPLDSDHTLTDIDVRLLATVRPAGDGSIPVQEELSEWFGEPLRLFALKDMKPYIPQLLAEFLRPCEAIGDVHVNWLLGLLCHDWPGNFGELRRYCERAKSKAAGMRRAVLCEALEPISVRRGGSAGSVGPAQVARSLLALSEREFGKTTDWGAKTAVPNAMANSLRLLVQLADDRRYDFREAGRGVRVDLPRYFHPYRIPLALFFDGGRCPACYDISVVLPERDGWLYPLAEFLRALATLVSNPSALAESERFREAFGTNPEVIATLEPTKSFVNWAGSLKASIPKYEELGRSIAVPPLPQKPKAKWRAAAPRRGKPQKQGRLGLAERAFPENHRLDPRQFAWHKLLTRYSPMEERIQFSYGGRSSKLWYIKELKGFGSGKSKKALNQAGSFLLIILQKRLKEFSVEDAMSWCEISPSRKDDKPKRRADPRAAAVQAVYRLNCALWDLVLACPRTGDESHNAITPSRSTGTYEVRFSVAGAETALPDDRVHGNSSSRLQPRRSATRRTADPEDRSDQRAQIQAEEEDRSRWNSVDPVTGLPWDPDGGHNNGRRAPVSEPDPNDEEAYTPPDSPGTLSEQA